MYCKYFSKGYEHLFCNNDDDDDDIIIFIINNNSIRNDNEGVIIMISFNSITAAIATTKADK
jgi:hypothetical protein